MTGSATLYRFRIDLSDVDRGVYEQLDLRVAKHPSESDLYLLTRVLAYALNFQQGIELSSEGLNDPDGPAIVVRGPDGGIGLWIEIGNPSAKKLHKASKAAAQVRVYTYKDPQMILKEAQNTKIHRAEQIEIIPLAPGFLDRLAKDLPREVRWQVLHHDGNLTVSTEKAGEQTEVVGVSLAKMKPVIFA